MPLYEYRCPDCRKVEDYIDPVENAPVHRCVKCGREMDRILSVFSTSSKSSSPDGGDCGSCESSGGCPYR